MFIPPSCIDSLYDYEALLKNGPLCKLPPHVIGKDVAIVGAGACGILVAHELLKMGLRPVIYEATDRLGGRMYTRYFEEGDDEARPFAELGAMRVPKSSRIFFHYAKKLHLTYDMHFPTPPKVNSFLYFNGNVHQWGPENELPDEFKKVNFLWGLFISQLVKPVMEAWKNEELETVKELWQMYIDQYKNKSFYEVLQERSPLVNSTQVGLFGSMGMGSSGFNSVFQVSFLEILRVILNDYVNNLVMVSQGVSEFANRLYRLPVITPHGTLSLDDMNCIRFNTSILSIDYNLKTNCPLIGFKDSNRQMKFVEYQAVVFTGTMCAAHLINLSGKTASGIYLFNSTVCDAIKSSNMIASSKTYICTKTKFWLDKTMPRCVVTDELPRATYFLDYPHTKYGVVCMSYTWGADAAKLTAVDPKDRVVMFRRIMESISPNLNKYLEPLNGEVINIDWVTQKYQNGAFKICSPGNDAKQEALFFQFQSVLNDDDKGVYLAGDSVSWSGGWIEGALYTGINAIYAVAKRFDAKIPAGSPLEQPHIYKY